MVSPTGMMEEVSFTHLWSAPLADNKGAPLERLDIEKEQSMLMGILGLKGGAGAARTGGGRPILRWRSEVASKSRFLRAMRHATVLHFSGHGTEDGLVLEHDAAALEDTRHLGKMALFKAAELADLFGVTTAPAAGGRAVVHVASGADREARAGAGAGAGAARGVESGAAGEHESGAGLPEAGVPQAGKAEAGEGRALKLAFVSACHSEAVGRVFAEVLGVKHVVCISLAR